MGWVKKKERLPNINVPVLVRYFELGEFIKQEKSYLFDKDVFEIEIRTGGCVTEWYEPNS